MYDKWNLNRNMRFHTNKIIYFKNMIPVFFSTSAKIRNVSANKSL